MVSAEPGAMVIFTGLRVMRARGFEVEEEAVRSDSSGELSASTLGDPEYYGEIRGIQEVVPRAHMRRALTKYIEIYARTPRPPAQKEGQTQALSAPPGRRPAPAGLHR